MIRGILRTWNPETRTGTMIVTNPGGVATVRVDDDVLVKWGRQAPYQTRPPEPCALIHAGGASRGTDGKLVAELWSDEASLEDNWEAQRAAFRFEITGGC